MTVYMRNFKILIEVFYHIIYLLDEDLEKSVNVLLDGVEYELIFLDEPLPTNNMVWSLL